MVSQGRQILCRSIRLGTPGHMSWKDYYYFIQLVKFYHASTLILFKTWEFLFFLYSHSILVMTGALVISPEFSFSSWGNGGPEIPLTEAEATPQPPCCPGACQAWPHLLCSAQHFLLPLEEISEIRSYIYEATELPEVEPRFRPGGLNPRTKASKQVIVRRGPSWRCIFGNLSIEVLS